MAISQIGQPKLKNKTTSQIILEAKRKSYKSSKKVIKKKSQSIKQKSFVTTKNKNTKKRIKRARKGRKIQWRTLEHNGPLFAPLYEKVPKSVKFYYNGRAMKLSEKAEEVASYYGKLLDNELTSKKVFNRNFFKDWKKVMNPKEEKIIQDLKKCDFVDFFNFYKKISEERKKMTKKEKLALNKKNEKLIQKYGFCKIDGQRQKIGNFKIEPPGLFRGRGKHPKMGKLKKRIEAEDISINIGKKAKIPKAPRGHKWKEICHDNTATWLAKWSENIFGSTKYIILHPSSKIKGKKDWLKYETARKLKNHIRRIRNSYTRDLKSKNIMIRQRAVALYFIDKLCLRVGNEKGEGTADTVGCCSLRMEHITLRYKKGGQNYVVTFNFLGKDSIKYSNTVPVDRKIYYNLKEFFKNKRKSDYLFDYLNTSLLNAYLNDQMKGLTTRVFRTYNSSKLFQAHLDQQTKRRTTQEEKILTYNRANRAVAILCNHQRTVPKNFSKSMKNLKAKINKKRNQIKKIEKKLKSAKKAAKHGGSKQKKAFDKTQKRLSQLEKQLEKLEIQAIDKEENKNIALGTSKLNYLDPRITVAWCKEWDVPIEKIYNRSQREKFQWAILMTGPGFKF